MKQEAKVQLRIPLAIRDWLATDAKRNHRSMNGQVVAILEERKDAEASKNDKALTGAGKQ